MKKIITLLALISTLSTFAQVPQGVSYQAIALNGSGNPVVNSNVGIRISVVDNTTTGTVLYTETHTKTTNPQGLFNLVIGQGTPTTGTFSAIDWRVNSKFLKVEMDAAGGTNYVLVGTTQLLSAPYALAADSLVTSAGEGITLVSPNGTPYQLTVNDAGQLSLPTSGVTGTNPSTVYMYGSFNGFNPATALLMNLYMTNPAGTDGVYNNAIYKYLTAGTEIKFLAENNSSSIIYGLNGSLQLIPNGSSHTIASNGFYFLNLYHYTTTDAYNFSKLSFAPTLINTFNNLQAVNPTYTISNNTFSFVLNGLTTSNFSTFRFYIPRNETDTNQFGNAGDNLNDGTVDFNGTSISIPNLT